MRLFRYGLRFEVMMEGCRSSHSLEHVPAIDPPLPNQPPNLCGL